MKTPLFIIILFFAVSSAVAQQTFNITASGTSFVPNLINVTVGDEVVFNAGFDHPVRQVSESTWNSNGTSPLSGGFDFPNGSGTIPINSPGTLYYVCVFHVGGGMKGRIMASSSTDVENVSENEMFNLYPNPVSASLNLINFRNNNIYNVKIIDFLGRTVLSFDNPSFENDLLRIDISQLSKGAYFLLIDTGEKSLARKFMKQ